MKLFSLTLCACMATAMLEAQDFTGYRTGSRTGVNGVFFNPASMAGSPYRWDANVFSISLLAGNNQASFRLKNLSDLSNGDSLRNQLFGKNAGAASGMASVDVHGPSFMLNTGKKWAFAFTSRVRAMANVSDVDGKLVNKITDDFSNDPQLPYTISTAQNMRVTVNGWSEFGLSAARVLFDEGRHRLKAGVTLKYLAGAANAYMNIDGFTGTLNADFLRRDVYLSNSAGKIAASFGGVRISGFDIGQLTKMNSKGVGADLGVVYEFRPDEKAGAYKLKLAVALLDIGSIRYKRDQQRSGAYTIGINGNKRLYFNELNGLDIDDYKNFFNSRPDLFTPAAGLGQDTYAVALPATLNTEIDYHISNGFYVHLGSQLSLTSESKLVSNRYKNSIMLTPRYEGKRVSVWLPVSYNPLTKLNAGLSVQAGPVFIGSGSILTALTGESKQADLYAGVRFGRLEKK